MAEIKIDWESIRKKYFRECVTTMMTPGHRQQQINYAPHDMFEWFKREIEKSMITETKEQ